MFPEHFPFSGWFQNCPNFSRSFLIFRTVSKLSGFYHHIYYIIASSRTLNTHSLAMSWEASTHFLGLSPEAVSRASSRKFLRVKSCYLDSFGFLCLCPRDPLPTMLYYNKFWRPPSFPMSYWNNLGGPPENHEFTIFSCIWSNNLQLPYTSKLEVKWYQTTSNMLVNNLQLPYKCEYWDSSNRSLVAILTNHLLGEIQGVPKKRTNKTNKNGQTWQAFQHSKVV